MKILVTGDRGYIGGNLTHYLTNKGHRVFGLDKSRGRGEHCVENILSVEAFDYIIHLAAISGIENCEENYDSAIMNNILATLHLFKISFNRVPVIFASSGSAQSPDYNFYAMTKKIGEMEAQRLIRLGSDITILRFANVYGGMDYLEKKNSVISKFIKGPIFVNGDGSQTRDFIHVDDVCRSIYMAIKSKKIVNIPIGIGTGINTSILDLAKMFGKEYNFNPDSEDIGLDESPAEIKSAKKYLKFKATMDLEDYIRGMTSALSPSTNTNSSTENPSES